ncbi:MAG: phosphoribosyltransferase family protein [Phycisphaeraceae bacterium]
MRETFNDLFPAIVDTEVALAAEGGWQIDAASSYCHRCGASVGPGEAMEKGCSHCVTHAVAWQRIVRLSAYKLPVEHWIVSMKFHRVWPWAKWFGRQLASAMGDLQDRTKTLVCPVPMPWLRRWRRGYNQAQIMSSATARALKVEHAELLQRRRWQPPQTSVLPSQRAANVRGCFNIQPVDLTGWHVILVDDVKTTGSTLSACTRLLKQAGAASVCVAVAAVADPKGKDFTRT